MGCETAGKLLSHQQNLLNNYFFVNGQLMRVRGWTSKKAEPAQPFD